MNRIAHFRALAGLTQGEMAAKVNWTTSRLGNYESGCRTPGLDESRMIVTALLSAGVSVTIDDVFPPSKSVCDPLTDSSQAA